MSGRALARTKVSRRKAMGVHYTPPLLAEFLARRLIPFVAPRLNEPLRVLDPACGDGVLLESVLTALREGGIDPGVIVGIEADEGALCAGRFRLSRFGEVRCDLIEGDFLELVSTSDPQAHLWVSNPAVPALARGFDVIIANPPYVRTQVLGAARAQRLAFRFGLAGRVDLYHAFLVAATESLRPGGVLGIIISNRFLTTLGGSMIRRYLAQHYDVREVIDLGDTKLFEAAVLPAIFIGCRRTEDGSFAVRPGARFVRVYSDVGSGSDEPIKLTPDKGIIDILSHGEPGRYRAREGPFEVTSGELVLGQNAAEVWSLITAEEREWVDRVRAASCGVFGDVSAVRVGIKTTADDVFIRSDWNELPAEMRPEPELLRPLLGHEDAHRWTLPRGAKPSAKVLYTHEVMNGCRRAIDLRKYPRARAYLEAHRDRLERRHYVLEAGREWYEIWVPQDPAAWIVPKIVFPDISPGPRFYLDVGGNIVDGDSYWITPAPRAPSDALYLLLGVANSKLMARFHDLAFNNRLYSGRRRYITQYVGKYPYPSPGTPAARELISLVRQAVRNCGSESGASRVPMLEARIDALVEVCFGTATA